MAFLLKKTESSIFTGDQTLSEWYVRISFVCDQNGKNLSVSPAYYDSVDSYVTGNPLINHNIPVSTYLITFNQYPSLLEIHESFQIFYTQFGFDCTIVDVEV